MWQNVVVVVIFVVGIRYRLSRWLAGWLALPLIDNESLLLQRARAQDQRRVMSG
jgi:hypothetical protein